jgi:predicted transposase YdaD
MGNKDIISKSIYQRLVRDFATYLFDLPVTDVELLETESHRIEDRRADLVAKVTDTEGQTFLLHIEIQNYNDPLMPQRMLRYLADLLLAYPDMWVRQFLVYIGKPPLRMAAGLDLPQMPYHYSLIDMHKVDCQELLRKDSPDAWVLAVLCDFKEQPPLQIVHGILTRLVERLNDEPPRLREYVSILEILSTNRELNLNIEEELNMLTINYEELPTYRMGLKKGIEKGIERGVEQGVEFGAHQQALTIAANLLAEGLSQSQVARLTQLPLAEVETLSREKDNSPSPK